jgi:phage terminase large subunit GpA-like protein
MTFIGRRYLEQVMASTAKRLVLRCSRQVEKTTLLVNRIIYNAVKYPGVEMLLVCPRLEQAITVSRSRLMPTIADSPFIRRLLLGRTNRRPPVMNCHFANGSALYVRAAYHSADAVRGLSADVLFVDEFQDIAAGDLAVLQETLSHSDRGEMVLTGTLAVFAARSAVSRSTPADKGYDSDELVAAIRRSGDSAVQQSHYETPLEQAEI